MLTEENVGGIDDEEHQSDKTQENVNNHILETHSSEPLLVDKGNTGIDWQLDL